MSDYGTYILKAVTAGTIWIGGLAIAGTEIEVNESLLGVAGATAAGTLAAVWKIIRDNRIEAQGRADYAAQQEFLERQLNAEITRREDEIKHLDSARKREGEAREETMKAQYELMLLKVKCHGLEIENQMLKGTKHDTQ